MNPQWNLFQPPSSESSAMDYNRSYSVPPPNNYTSSNSSMYNGYYDSQVNNGMRSSKPPTMMPTPQGSHPPVSPHYSNPPVSSYYNSTAPSRPTSFNQMSNSTPEVAPQSNFYSDNSNSNSQYTPPVADFKIGTFTLNSNGYPCESNCLENSSSGSQNSNTFQSNGPSSNSSSASQSSRETGIIEKLLQTYGFIQCCERQARLFFHFSQFDGNTEHLRIGDPVEFEVTFDRRTGKPIASTVTKISPEVALISAKVLSEERVVGLVTTGLKSEHSGEHQGRISYENRGECFFLPYGKDDVEGYVTLKSGDKVSFQIATNQRSGNLASRHVRLENPVEPVKYQGVVSAIKDSYGFIERADVVDEIFFHFTEAKSIPGGLKLGDDVEFLIQTKNCFQSKEVATDMVKLPPGTVVFEDINPDTIRGQVLKSVEKVIQQNSKDPLTGRIRYRGQDRSEVEVKFGERDQKGDFSLRHGDWVKFNIATDRRDHLQKATNISLLDESFNVSGEKREQGIVNALKDSFGYIKCTDRDARMFFNYNELLDPQREICIGEEVEFTMAPFSAASSEQGTPPPIPPQSANKLCATRIRRLPKGTVKFELLIQEGLKGEVTFEPIPQSHSPTVQENGADPIVNPGVITHTLDGMKQTLHFYPLEGKKLPQIGDSVEFNMYLIKRTKERVAMDIKVIPSLITSITPNSVTTGRQPLVGSGRTLDRGSISTSTLNSFVPSVPSYNKASRSEYSSDMMQQPNSGLQARESMQMPRENDIGSRSFSNQDQFFGLNEKSFGAKERVFNSNEDIYGRNRMYSENTMDTENKSFAVDDDATFALDRSTRSLSEASNSDVDVVCESTPPHTPPTPTFLIANGKGNSTLFQSSSPNLAPNGKPSISVNECASHESVSTSSNTKPSSFSSTTGMTSFSFGFSSSALPESASPSKNSLALSHDVSSLSSKSLKLTLSPLKRSASPLNPSSGTSADANDSISSAPSTTTTNSFSSSSSSTRSKPIHQGYIATLKDSFGFIETANHDKEIFFHFSTVDGSSTDLDLGQEVEYMIAQRTGPGGKLSAENVKILPMGSLPMPKILGNVHEGTVLRSMRSVNPDQQEYCGQVCVGKEDEKLGRHQFGITGLVNKKELLQPGDLVTFQLDDDGWAVNIRAVRKKLSATVETVKGQYGFLNYGSDEGRRLFYHQSEVKDNATLSPGDEVEFVIITNLKTGKSSACNIVKVPACGSSSQRAPRSQRPERLMSKLKGLTLDHSKPRIQVIRKPRGPDGTRGFKVQRHLTPP